MLGVINDQGSYRIKETEITRSTKEWFYEIARDFVWRSVYLGAEQGEMLQSFPKILPGSHAQAPIEP